MYGQGIYFTDESCKSNQYAQPDKNGHCTIILSRVALGRALNFEVGPKDHGGLVGMKRPESKDEVFRQKVNKADRMKTFESVIVTGKERIKQVHKEVIVFDKDQAYPEFLVTYKLSRQSEVVNAVPKQKWWAESLLAIVIGMFSGLSYLIFDQFFMSFGFLILLLIFFQNMQ